VNRPGVLPGDRPLRQRRSTKKGDYVSPADRSGILDDRETRPPAKPAKNNFQEPVQYPGAGRGRCSALLLDRLRSAGPALQANKPRPSPRCRAAPATSGANPAEGRRRAFCLTPGYCVLVLGDR
jgi:hypothetical protein